MMTGAEWLASAEPAPTLRVLGERVGELKARPSWRH